MTRRLHASNLAPGLVQLDEREAHHLRDVLRLRRGDAVELFDDTGGVAGAVVEQCDAHAVTVRVERIEYAEKFANLIVAAAVPKGERADWMIEKLSEVGVDRFVPLHTERTVVLPKGQGKQARWQRIAIESAKQSRRRGVMQLEPLTPLDQLIVKFPSVQHFFLSMAAGAIPLPQAIASIDAARDVLLLIGPEGGWTDDEITMMRGANLTGVRLTETILRIETAAIVAAGVIATSRAAAIRTRTDGSP